MPPTPPARSRGIRHPRGFGVPCRAGRGRRGILANEPGIVGVSVDERVNRCSARARVARPPRRPTPSHERTDEPVTDERSRICKLGVPSPFVLSVSLDL